MIWRTISRCCVAVLWLLTVVVGVAMYVAAFSPATRALAGATLVIDDEPPLLLQSVATVLLVLALLLLLAALRRRPRSQPMLRFDTPDGHIVIATATLARFIRAIIRNDGRVSSAHVTTELDERKINVQARITVSEDQPITALATGLQQTVRQRVFDAFGFDLLRDIRVEVAGIVPHREHTRHLLAWGHHDTEQDGDANAGRTGAGGASS